VVAPTTAVPISTGFAVALKVLPAPSLASSRYFSTLEVDGQVEVFSDFGFNVGNLLDERKFVDGLSVVGDGAVGIDGDGDRTHARKPKATNPKAKTAGASMVAAAARPMVLK